MSEQREFDCPACGYVSSSINDEIADLRTNLVTSAQIIGDAADEIASLRAQLAEADATIDAFSAVSPQQYQKDIAELRAHLASKNSEWLAIAGGLRNQLAKAEDQLAVANARIQDIQGGAERYWEGRWRDADAQLASARKAMKEASDLLAERIYGSNARSPGHNARLKLEAALTDDTGKS